MTAALDSKVLDAPALRSVLAHPEESIVVAIVEPQQRDELLGVLRLIDQLRGMGERVKLVVYGDSSAILDGFDSAGIAFLESWAQPLLSAVFPLANAIVALGERQESLIRESVGPGGLPLVLQGTVEANQLLGLCRSRKGTRSDSPSSRYTSTRRFVLQNDWGIGDELLLSAVVREILRARPELEIWVRSRFGFRFPEYVRRDPIPKDARTVETIYQNLTLYGPSAHSPFPGHLVQQMLDKFALDTGVIVKAQDLRPEVALPAGVLCPPSERSVALNSEPNPRMPSKDWGIDRWVRLAEILRDQGVLVRQLGGKKEKLLPGAEDLRGVPIPNLPEVVARSAAVVTVVGLLMHVAEATRTPAVVIYGGREHPAIDGYPDQVHLSSGPLPCRGRWGCHLAPDLQCPHAMKCMDHLTPELVAMEVLSALKRRTGP